MASDTETRKVKAILERHKKMEQEKNPWLKNYQKIGEMVMTRKQNFTSASTQGEFVTTKLFSGAAGRANHNMSSALLGALWPNGSKSIQIVAPDDMKEEESETEEVKAFFARVTKTVAEVIDNPLAGFATALDEYMLDQGAFGISGIAAYETEDEHMPIRFEAVDAKKITISENKYGAVDTVYICKEMTIKQLVATYGEDKVSTVSANMFNKGQLEEKVKVLHAIEPRVDRIIGGYGNGNYPIASIEIEIDRTHTLREMGFHEMPVFVTRFWKAMGEIYGRSPAMELMPEIAELNIQTELIIRAGEKNLNPPIIVSQENIIGNGSINTSAGAVNVKRMSGRAEGTGKAVEQIITVGEMQSTYKRIDVLEEIIKNGFLQDRLMDLNNEQRMTLGETNIRNELRGQTLGNIYLRQIIELFAPLIGRVMAVLVARDKFGFGRQTKEARKAEFFGIPIDTIPDAIFKRMVEGKDWYKATFISPAARILRREELTGLMEFIGDMERMAPISPDVMDNVNPDELARTLVELRGAPMKVMRSKEEISKIRQGRAEAQAEQQKLMMAQAQAEIAKTGAMAAQHAAKAGLPIQMPGQEQMAS